MLPTIIELYAPVLSLTKFFVINFNKNFYKSYKTYFKLAIIKDYIRITRSIPGFAVSLTIRMLGGEALLGWQATVAYPWYDAALNKQYFPYKTIAMVAGLIVMLAVSYLTDWLMRTERLHVKWLMKINNRIGRDDKSEKSSIKSEKNSIKSEKSFIKIGENNLSYSNSDNVIVESESNADFYESNKFESTKL